MRKKIDYSVNRDKYNSYSREIERLVPPSSEVLDIGCTTGGLAKALKKKRCKVVGIDIDQASLKVAAKYCEKVYKVDVDDLKDFNAKLKGRKFDVIAIGDLLEHLKHPGVFLFHLKKYLSSDGMIIAKIPNSAFVWLRMRFLLGNFTYQKGGGLMDEDHLRFFSFKSAKQLFLDDGYKIEKMMSSNEAIQSKRFFLIRPLGKIWPSLFSIHMIVVAKNG
jgi:SAM-dependent methyltransferase